LLHYLPMSNAIQMPFHSFTPFSPPYHCMYVERNYLLQSHEALREDQARKRTA
jgi:hypothetical protein